MFLLLTLNIFQTFFFGVSIADFEWVNVSCEQVKNLLSFKSKMFLTKLQLNKNDGSLTEISHAKPNAHVT